MYATLYYELPLNVCVAHDKNLQRWPSKKGKKSKKKFIFTISCLHQHLPKCTRFYRALVMFSPYLSHISNSFVFYRLTKCNADTVRRHGQLCSTCVFLTLSSHSIGMGMLCWSPSWWWDATKPSKFDLWRQISTVIKFWSSRSNI